MIKIVTLFLAGMAVLAMFGRLRYPGQKTIERLKCPTCGRYRVTERSCDCDKE